MSFEKIREVAWPNDEVIFQMKVAIMTSDQVSDLKVQMYETLLKMIDKCLTNEGKSN